MPDTSSQPATHTGELNATCALSVALRRQGFYEPEVPQAMLRGLLVGEVLRLIHERDWWDRTAIAGALQAAKLAVAAEQEQNGRIITTGATNALPAIEKKVAETVDQYIERFGERFQSCRLIGCELPLRLVLDADDGEPIVFETHLDLCYRDAEGALCLWDWKFTEVMPDFHYLTRWPQGICLCLCLARGVVLIEGEWVELGEWPRVAWCHLPNLHVYQRGGAYYEDDGQGNKIKVAYKKGDRRPEDKIIRWINYHPTREQEMARWLTSWAQLIAQESPPASPSPDGCRFCDSNRFCPAFDRPVR